MSKLSGDDWQQLIGELLEAELHVAGLTAADLERALAANRPDGGTDAFLQRGPARTSAFLTHGPCAFQFKRVLPSISSLASEIARSNFLRPKLARGLSYALVVGSDLGVEQAAIAAALVGALKKEQVTATGSIEVFGADWVLRWLRSHPFAWRYVPDAPAAALHLKTLEQWSSAQQKAGTNFPWTEDQERTEVLKALFAQLGTPGKTLRLQGPPGVGKSRLALEVARRFSATSHDVVILDVDEAGAEDLSGFSGIPMQGLLIVDECSLERHRTIQRNWQSTRGSVLTIGSEDLRDLARDDATSPWIGPLRLDQLRTLARNTPSTLDEPTRIYLAEKSGGYLKLFRLLLDAVMAARPPLLSATSLSQRDLLELLEKFITRQNNVDDRRARAVRALALPTFVASIKNELPILAAAVGLTKHDLEDARTQLTHLALLGSLPGGLYVTPRLLGDWLAERCWAGRECDFLEGLRAAGADRSLIWRCIQRLAGGSRQGVSSLKALITECGAGLKASLGSSAVAELIARISASQPEDALGLADHLISVSPSDMSKEGAHALARALARCAWEVELFDRAVVLLARSPEPGGDSFAALFGAATGLTKADGRQRLAALRRLSAGDQGVRLLVVGALEECLGEQTHRFVSFPTLRLQDAWRPRSSLEELEYRRSAAALLEPLFSDGDPDVRRAAFDAARHSMRSLARNGFIAIGVQLIRSAALAGAPLDMIRAEARSIEDYDLPRLDDASRQLWVEAQEILTPRTAQERAIAYARAHRVGKAADSAASEIAAALLHEVDLSALFDVLGAESAPLSFDLGRALGSLDSDRRLLNIIRSGAPRWRHLRFAAAYVIGLGGPSEDLLDELSAHLGLAALTFEATWLSTPSARGAHRLLRLLAEGTIEPKSFQQLLLGGWLMRVDAETASLVIRALSADGVVAFRLAFQRVMGSDGDKALTSLLIASWERLGLEEIRQVAWEWLEVEPLVPPEIAASRCIEALRASLISNESAPDEVLQALASAATRAPARTWSRLAALAEAVEPHRRPTLALQLRGHLSESQDLIDSILAWVGADPDRRSFAAAIAAPVADSDQNLASRVLDLFPTDPVVCAHLRASFMSGAFHQESEFWHERLQALQSMANSKRPALASWARSMISEVEHSLSRASEVEQAYAEGVLELPMFGERLPE